LNTDISQGSVATRLGCGGVFLHDFVTNFLLSLTVKKILKIGQYLVKLWARVRCLVFFDSRCSFVHKAPIKTLLKVNLKDILTSFYHCKYE